MTTSNTVKRNRSNLSTDSWKRRFAGEVFVIHRASAHHSIPLAKISGATEMSPIDMFPVGLGHEIGIDPPPAPPTRQPSLHTVVFLSGIIPSIDTTERKSWLEGPVVPSSPTLHWSYFDLASGLSSVDALLKYLRVHEKNLMADRIQQFLDVRNEDPEEPPIVTESLRSLVEFIIQEPMLRPPAISSDPEGLMELEWHLADDGNSDSIWGRGKGVVSMRFLQSGNIRYVALSGPYRRGLERLRILGEATKREMIARLGPFAQRVTL